MRRTTAAAAALGLLVGLGTAGVGLAVADRAPHPTPYGWTGGAGMMAGGMHGWSGRSGMMTVTSEAGWLREMVAHHREAIAAAGELARSDRAAMRAFGRRIVADQSAQVRLMEGWLEEWYDDEAGADATYQPMMRDLSDLTGDALDRAFLQDMVVHHMAAVMMSQQLLVHGLAEHDEVVQLARTIRTDQSREIVWMRQQLAALS